MRGYERKKVFPRASRPDQLFLPMRGYEPEDRKRFEELETVISPHEGL